MVSVTRNNGSNAELHKDRKIESKYIIMCVSKIDDLGEKACSLVPPTMLSQFCYNFCSGLGGTLCEAVHNFKGNNWIFSYIFFRNEPEFR